MTLPARQNCCAQRNHIAGLKIKIPHGTFGCSADALGACFSISSRSASFADGCGTQLIGSQTYNKVRGKVTVDFYAEDACGNSGFVDQATFGAIDTLPPVISGSNTVEQCGGQRAGAMKELHAPSLVRTCDKPVSYE